MPAIVIIAGGTGGHIFPGLAVADELASLGHDIFWIGSQNSMEQKLVPSLFPFHSIAVHQLRGKGMRAKLLFPARLLRGVVQALRQLRRIKPCAVVTFGGYVSGPGALAAKLLRIPLIIHEQNARAGLTNRYLSKISNQTLQAFPHAFPKKIAVKTVGNPVRRDILAIPQPQQCAPSSKLKVLVLGGSLGALAVNKAVVAWAEQYEHAESIQLMHQAGDRHIDTIKEAYANHKIDVTPVAFIDDMAAALSFADIVICRAGALTVSEIAAVGLAAIFVPMPHAVDNHQYYNARYLSDQGAAVLVEQKFLNTQTLNDAINDFLQNPSRVLEMSQKARGLSMRDATSTIARHVVNLSSHLSLA